MKKDRDHLPRLLTARDIAQRLNVSEYTVHRWCRMGKIPCMSISRIYRFDRDRIEEWLASRHRGPEPTRRTKGEVA